MKVCLPASKRVIVCVGLMLTFVAEACAVQLLAEQEAAYPDDPYSGDTRGSPTAGPEIEVVSPKLSGLINSPFHFKVKLRAHGGATIDLDSIAVTYKKLPAIDITQRIKTFIVNDGIDVADARLPAGTHPFRIDVKDSRGRWGAPLFFKIAVAK